jgi:hypothetical protein
MPDRTRRLISVRPRSDVFPVRCFYDILGRATSGSEFQRSRQACKKQSASELAHSRGASIVSDVEPERVIPSLQKIDPLQSPMIG